jgi:hypothetical protein
MTKIISIALVSIALTAAAPGPQKPPGTVPEAEGVYLLTTDAQLMRLHSARVRRCSTATSNQTYDILSGRGRADFGYIDSEGLKDVPVVDPAKIKGVYIKARAESLQRIGQIADIAEFLEGRHILTGVFPDGCSRDEGNVETSSVVLSHWSWGRDKVTILPIDSITEYVQLEDDGVLQNRSTESVTSKSGDNIPCIGININTGRDSYPVFFRAPHTAEHK